MATALAASDVTALTDRIGAIWKRAVDLAATTPATDMVTGAADLVSDLEGLSLAKANLYAAAVLAVQTAVATPYLAASTFATLVRAFNSDLGGLDAYATANTIQLYEYFRDLAALNGLTLSAANVFKATNQTLATFAATGATTGTFVATGALDTTLYAPSQCELIVTSAITSSTTVTLTMHKKDGTTENKTVNLTAADTVGTVVAIGSAGDVYADCDAISVTGATSGDAFTVRTTVLRSPAV